jgi:cell division protein FtsQ
MTAPTLPPTRKPRIEPRIRQRRIDVKREEGRRRLRFLIAGTAAVVVLAMLVVAARSPLVGVRHVRVIGASRTNPNLIVTTADIGGAMLGVNAGRAAAAVDQLPWVATAHVRRQWPATVVITVTERKPVALVGPPNALVQVDAGGRVLAPVDGLVSLPVVALAAGVSGAAPGAPSTQIDAVYAPGIATAAALPASLVSRVIGIFVAGDGTVTLGLIGHGSAQLGSATSLGQKLSDVVALLDHGAIGAGTADVTVPAAPVVAGGS